jgi:hypothetical protein
VTVLGIDPGSEHSAWVLYDGQRVYLHGMTENGRLLREIRRINADGFECADIGRLVIEEITSYGMPVGREVFATVFWSGRFAEAFNARRWAPAGQSFETLPRRDVKLHLCQSARAKDANVRQVLIDRFGGKEKAIGRKATPGHLYGIKADCWQALAIAVTWVDLHGAHQSEAQS